jgi:hypothetical protein
MDETAGYPDMVVIATKTNYWIIPAVIVGVIGVYLLVS